MGGKCCSGQPKDAEKSTEAPGDALLDELEGEDGGADYDGDAAAAAIAAMAAAAVASSVGDPGGAASSSSGAGLGGPAKANDDGGEDIDKLLEKEEEMRKKQEDAPRPTATGAPTPVAVGSTGDFTSGDLVEISGLKSATDLNGKQGRIASLNKDSGRWEVTLASGEVKALRPDNLILKQKASHTIFFKPGDVIEVTGLKMATSLNGQLGGVIGPAAGDSGRWEVLFADKSTKALRPENLIFKERGAFAVNGKGKVDKKPLTPEQRRRQQEADARKAEKKEQAYRNLAGAADDLGCGQQ